MQHQIRIIFDKHQIWEVQAETNLGPLPQQTTPALFFGRLLEMTEDRLVRLKSSAVDHIVAVSFQGITYKFSVLDESSGDFEVLIQSFQEF